MTHRTLTDVVKQYISWFSSANAPKCLAPHLNDAFMTSGIPSEFFVALIDADVSPEKLPSLIDDETKTGLNTLAEKYELESQSHYTALARSIAKSNNISDVVRMAIGINQNRYNVIPFIVHLDDPVKFLATASNDAFVYFSNSINIEDTAAILEPLSDFKRQELMRIFPKYDNDAAVFLGGKPNETMTACVNANPHEMEKYFHESLSCEATGVLLRTVRGPVLDAFWDFRKAYNLKQGSDFPVLELEMEPFVKQFIERYMKEPENQEETVKIMIYQTTAKICMMRAIAEYGVNSPQCLLVENGQLIIKDEDIDTILSNDALVAQANSTDDLRSWNQLYLNTTPNNMAKMSSTELQLVLRAEDLSSKAEQGFKFYKGFNKAIKGKHVEEWARAVIKHHEEDVVGGDQYHKREVLAA
jgi:hypothetical protein